MHKFYFDNRWIGKHGIGRFAYELRSRILTEDANLTGSPSSPLDPLKLTVVLLNQQKKIFSPGYNAPLSNYSKYAFTIHDLNHIYFEKNIQKKLYYDLVIKPACKKCPFIFTVSEFTKNQISEWANISPEKIINIGNGLSKDFINQSFTEQKKEIKNNYILCVSNRRPHKNEMRLINAYSNSRINPEIKLIFTGKPNIEILKFIHSKKLQSKIQFTDSLTDSELATLYKNACMLAFPSLYEGFGLPIIESMACGTPVLTSNVTSMPEISGNAAYLVDPMSEESITAGIEAICNDQILNSSLIQLGLENSRKYRWEYSVNKLLDVLKDF